MMDNIWQIDAVAANGTTKSEWAFNLKFSGMRSTTGNGNALLAENKLYGFRSETFFLFSWL